ncbi:TPA: hypothetical protein N2F56_004327, partial [Salmonella enterica]|nr:hypothetical protein [Salmonella enterica]HCL5083778.1 hypothetical protein [Salmonella enterica]
MGRLILNVPFSEKDEAKSKGARWDPELKKWYIPEGVSGLWLIPWIEELMEREKYNIFNEYYFIGESERNCWKCGRRITLFAFCLPSGFKKSEIGEFDNAEVIYLESDGTWLYYDDCMLQEINSEKFISWSESSCFSAVSDLIEVAPRALSHMRHFAPTWGPKYSETVGYTYYANSCPHCGRLQGDFHIFSEPGGAFLPVTPKHASQIKLHKIDEPIFLNGGTCYTSYDFFEYMTRVS